MRRISGCWGEVACGLCWPDICKARWKGCVCQTCQFACCISMWQVELPNAISMQEPWGVLHENLARRITAFSLFQTAEVTKIGFCHKTDVFIAEACNTEAKALALSSFPFLCLTSASRKCRGPLLNPNQPRREHQGIKQAKIKTTSSYYRFPGWLWFQALVCTLLLFYYVIVWHWAMRHTVCKLNIYSMGLRLEVQHARSQVHPC